MSYSETQVPLSPHDVERITALSKSARKFVLFFGLGIFALFCIVFFSVMPHDSGAMVVGGVLAAVVLLTVLLMYKRMVGKFTKDLSNGYKFLIKGQVTSRYMEEIETGSKNKTIKRYYYFVFGEKKTRIDGATYQRVQDGDHVELEKTPFSSIVLNVKTSVHSPLAPAEAEKPHVKKTVDGFMNDDEVRYLQQMKSAAKKRTALTCATMLIPLIAFSVIMLTAFNQQDVQKVQSMMLLPCVPILGMLVYFIVVGARQVGQLSKDIAEARKTGKTVEVRQKCSTNRKRVAGGKVTLSSRRNVRYYYLVADKWYEVNEQVFHESPDHGPVTLIMAPASQVVLGVTN